MDDLTDLRNQLAKDQKEIRYYIAGRRAGIRRSTCNKTIIKSYSIKVSTPDCRSEGTGSVSPTGSVVAERVPKGTQQPVRIVIENVV